MSISILSKLFKDEMSTVASVGAAAQIVNKLECGDPALSWCLGSWTLNRPNLIYGPSGSGKSALASIGAGKAQKKRPGSLVIFNDTEFYYHEQPDRIKRLEKYGIDIDNTMIIPGNTLDDAFGKLAQIENLLKEGKIDVSAWVIDSWQGIENISAAKKLDENKNGEGASDAGNAHRGNAKSMNPILTRILGLCAKYKITLFIVQHVMVSQDQYGPKFQMLGGEKLRHLCDSILYVESISAKDSKLNADGEVAGQDDIVVGKKIRGRGEKTRNTVEGKKVEFWMDFENCSFAKAEESLLSLAENLGVVYTPFELEVDANGKPVIDKKTGKQKKKEERGYYEANLENGVFKVFGRPKMLEKLKDPSVFAQVQKACMQSNSMNASKGTDEDAAD
jgi:RecA/RadA recombinase